MTDDDDLSWHPDDYIRTTKCPNPEDGWNDEVLDPSFGILKYDWASALARGPLNPYADYPLGFAEEPEHPDVDHDGRLIGIWPWDIHPYWWEDLTPKYVRLRFSSDFIEYVDLPEPCDGFGDHDWSVSDECRHCGTIEEAAGGEVVP